MPLDRITPHCRGRPWFMSRSARGRLLLGGSEPRSSHDSSRTGSPGIVPGARDFASLPIAMTKSPT